MRFFRLFTVCAGIVFCLGGGLANAAALPQAVTITIVGPDAGIAGPDGQPHAAFVPASVVVKAGTPVRLTFLNYSGEQHNFVQPKLNLDLVIGSAASAARPSTTVVTFTPKQRGVYRWFCSLPCDKEQGMWAMGRGYGGPGKEGFMAGNIVVR